MVRLAGIEPTTPWFVAKYSIQLSYSRDGISVTRSVWCDGLLSLPTVVATALFTLDRVDKFPVKDEVRARHALPMGWQPVDHFGARIRPTQ